jgi:NAD(P)-dependent dehydrogenase (short-subunit alcohol dehydrogenase family)
VNGSAAPEAIVISGASTGIGADCAERLARDGFVVYAGVRTDADGERIAALHPNVRALRLDVTDDAAIAAAVTRVRDDGVTLRGVVNNAGIAIPGPLEFLPIAEVRRQFDVNFFGALSLTQAFLPLVRPARGRIVFVGSISGRLAVPFIAPYSTSKFALHAAADALRVELSPSGMHVALVEPSSVKTPIWEKGRTGKQHLIDQLPPQALELYGGAIDALYTATEGEERIGMPPAKVTDAIVHALTAAKPHAYYLLGGPARAGSIIALLPPVLRDRALRASMKLP